MWIKLPYRSLVYSWMCWVCAVRHTHTHAFLGCVCLITVATGNRVLFKVFVPVPTTSRAIAAAPHTSWLNIGVLRGSVSFYFVFKLPVVFQWVLNLDSQWFFRRLLAIWASFLMKLGSVKIVRSSAQFALVLCIKYQLESSWKDKFEILINILLIL